jgi:hypothetical protein
MSHSDLIERVEDQEQGLENTQKVKFRGHRHSIISTRDRPAKL